jgi:hypothetical protein
MKIFQIGFNKCATTSLYFFFKLNGIESVHWAERQEGKINSIICLKAIENLSSNRNMFEGMEYVFYSDMEFISSRRIIYLYEYYKIMDEQYPDSKFILNTRNLDDWIKSRLNHQGPFETSYLKRSMDYFRCNEDKVIKIWKNHYRNHINGVLSYFKNKPGKLLHFKLEKDDANNIIDFLPEFTFRFKKLPEANLTVDRGNL